ncbi:MAG: GatB/YqeY domain-containing protein [Candidatus Limimorpha sp.]
MTLETQIMADIKQAMLARDSKKLEALRAVKAQLLLEKTKGSSDEISEATELAILQKLVKQRKESAAIYIENGRQELADEELFQASVIEVYLPKPISEEELTEIIKGIIAQTGAASMKDMGKVMGIATKQVAGKADNAKISQIVRTLLGA